MQGKTNTIPPFDERGNLPSGIHKATIDDVVERFGIPKSLKRSMLAKNLRIFYGFAKKYATAIYIDGSFITSKLSPNDIDILVIFSNKFRTNRDLFIHLYELRKSHKRNKLHVFPYFETDLEMEAKWLEWFTTTRRDDHNNQFPKGIICLEINND